MDLVKCPNCGRKETLVEIRSGIYRMINTNTGEVRAEAVLDGEVAEQIEKPFPGKDSTAMLQRGETYVRPKATTVQIEPVLGQLTLGHFASSGNNPSHGGSGDDFVDGQRIPVQKFGILCGVCGYFRELPTLQDAKV